MCILDKCFDTQLDTHHASGAMLPLISLPKPVDGKKPNVLWIYWNNAVNSNGDCTCRLCLNRSKCAAPPWLRQFVQTYDASCVELQQPCMHLFFTLAAAMGLVVTFGNMKNAYQ